MQKLIDLKRPYNSDFFNSRTELRAFFLLTLHLYTHTHIYNIIVNIEFTHASLSSIVIALTSSRSSLLNSVRLTPIKITMN